ncbi:MAG: serine hydrolase, partial [Acidobacteriota bacterium]
MDSNALWARVTERLEDWHRALAAPATGLVLVEPGAEDRYRLLGTSARGSDHDLTPRSVFPIGELSEGFVAGLAALGVNRGQLQWDDKVVSRLPSVKLSDPALAMRLTLRDLLGHRSGFAAAPWLEGSRVDLREIAVSLRDAEVFDPEQNFHRSALNYRLALEVLAKSGGAPWASLLETELLRPLGLKSTAPPGRAAAAGDLMQGSVDTLGDAGALARVPFPEGGPSDAPAGSLESSLGDLALWMKFLLAPAEVRGLEMEKKDLAKLWVGKSPIAPGVGFGLGFRVSAHRGYLIVSQTGQAGGVSTTLSLLPELQRGLALVQNLGESPLAERSQREIWDLLLPEAPPALAADATFPGAAPEDDSEAMPMCFRSEEDELDAMVFARGRRLFLDVPGQATARLEGPNKGGGYYYTERDRVLGAQLLRPSEDVPPASMLLHHFLRFPGFREPPQRSEARAGQGGSITEAERLPGRYRIAHVSLDVDVTLDDGQPKVTSPDDYTYSLTDVAGLGHWLLDSTRIQS